MRVASRKSKMKCTLCGRPVKGTGTVCAACSGIPDAASASRRVAEKVRDRLSGGETGAFVCPFCRCELTWETLGTSETEVTIYVREKIFFLVAAFSLALAGGVACVARQGPAQQHERQGNVLAAGD